MKYKINKLFKKYNFHGMPGSLQYWELKSLGEGQYLTVEGQPFLSNLYDIGLVRYRENCLKYPNWSIGTKTDDEPYWLACLAAQTRVAAQRTHRDPIQIMGQLGVPVYDPAANDAFVGVIEFITIVEKESYAAEFIQIEYLLKKANLATKPIEKMIKAVYKGDIIIRFPLSFSCRITCLWEEVTMRFKTVNQNTCRISYKDCNGTLFPISNDEDLWACIAKSSSNTIRIVIIDKEAR